MSSAPPLPINSLFFSSSQRRGHPLSRAAHPRRVLIVALHISRCIAEIFRQVSEILSSSTAHQAWRCRNVLTHRFAEGGVERGHSRHFAVRFLARVEDGAPRRCRIITTSRREVKRGGVEACDVLIHGSSAHFRFRRLDRHHCGHHLWRHSLHPRRNLCRIICSGCCCFSVGWPRHHLLIHPPAARHGMVRRLRSYQARIAAASLSLCVCMRHYYSGFGSRD